MFREKGSLYLAKYGYFYPSDKFSGWINIREFFFFFLKCIIFHKSWEPFRLYWMIFTSHSMSVTGDVTCLHISPHLAAAAAVEMLAEKEYSTSHLHAHCQRWHHILLRHKSQVVGSLAVHQLSRAFCLQEQLVRGT